MSKRERLLEKYAQMVEQVEEAWRARCQAKLDWQAKGGSMARPFDGWDRAELKWLDLVEKCRRLRRTAEREQQAAGGPEQI